MTMPSAKNIISVSRLPGTWTPEVAADLTATMFQLRDQMTRGITETVHTKSQYIDATFTAPLSTALVVRTNQGRRPETVELESFREVSPTARAVSIAGSLQWEWDNGNIILPQLAGITGSRTYSVRLLVREAA
jgi:hypothetical protein